MYAPETFLSFAQIRDIQNGQFRPCHRLFSTAQIPAYESEREAFEFATSLLPDKHVPTLEAQMMDWADDVTFSVHDLEDFYRAARLPLHLLAQRDPQEREHFFSNVFARRKGEKPFSSRQHFEDAFHGNLDIHVLYSWSV